MFNKVNGKVIEHGGFIPIKSNVKFSFRDRLKILFGEPVAYYVHIFTKNPVEVIDTEARAGVGKEHAVKKKK